MKRLPTSGPCYTSSAAAFSNDQNGLRGRLIVAGAAALGRDFCAAVGLATILLGHMQEGAWLTASMHDRLLLGATDAALALSMWRAGCLHTEVLRRFGALGTPCPPAAGEHPAAEAAAALAALSWGATGGGLTAAVSSEVHALHIQLLQKDATILRLTRLLEGPDAGGDADMH